MKRKRVVEMNSFVTFDCGPRRDWLSQTDRAKKKKTFVFLET